MQDQALCERLGRAARRTVEDHFAIARINYALEAIIRQHADKR